MLWRIFELSFSVFQLLVKYACIDSVAIEKVQPEWRADTGEPCLRNLGSSLVSCSFWSVTIVLVTFAIWFVAIADFMVSGPFWSLVPALSMVYSSNFFPVAEFPPLFSSRSSKLDLLSLAADENQMWVLTVAVWSAWAPPLSALVPGGQCVTDGAFRSKEKPAIKVHLFFWIGLANFEEYFCASGYYCSETSTPLLQCPFPSVCWVTSIGCLGVARSA